MPFTRHPSSISASYSRSSLFRPSQICIRTSDYWEAYYLMEPGHRGAENDRNDEIFIVLHAIVNTCVNFLTMVIDADNASMCSSRSSVPSLSRRRSWSPLEEKILINALKQIVSEGWKSDNGFRSGYQ